MSRSPILLPSHDISANTPTPPSHLVEDVIGAAWHTVDTLPEYHPLRPSLIYAVWALEDTVDSDSSVAAALPIVVGLLAAVSV